MLDEKEPPAGAQHPAQLAQGPGLVVDPAQDQRRDRHVEGVVVEGEILGRARAGPWRTGGARGSGAPGGAASAGSGSVIVSDRTSGP